MSSANRNGAQARRAAGPIRAVLGVLVATCLSLAVGAVHADLVYQQNFNGLTAGHTQPVPGAPGQDGWYSALAAGSGFGEIQGGIANAGQALHEFTPISNPPGLQTIDRKDFAVVDIRGAPFVNLSFDFYAHSSDLGAVNNFLAAFEIRGGPSPGFQILGVDLRAGNGTAKRLTGLRVSLVAYNGVDNNVPIPLTVGQALAFDTWHRASVSINQAQDRYIAVTVDGQTQDLSAFVPVRTFANGQSLRGQRIENLVASIIPDKLGGTQTNDDVYWDNVQLTALTVPEPSSAAMFGLGLVALCGLARFARARGRNIG